MTEGVIWSMSFVYAENLNGSLEVYCDTKIGLNGPVGANFSEEQLKLIQRYGIVKTTIICPEISISFAGNNIFLATKLFRMLYERKVFTTKEIVDLAYYIHLNSNINDIEFLVASCENDTLSIYCIKEKKVQSECQMAWIGSSVAHREFQERRLRNNNGIASERTGLAFQEVIEGCSDQTVGGLCIQAGYDLPSKSMGYRECISFQSSKSAIVQPGESIPFFLSASDGGFSYEQIPVSLEDLIVHIFQMEQAILYSRRLRMSDYDMNNSQLFSLMLPMLIREDGYGGWIGC